MKKLIPVVLIAVLLISCTGHKRFPDVSGIKIPLTLLRFDEDFFSLDTNNITAGLTRLQSRYPDFLLLFLHDVIGTNDTGNIKLFLKLSTGIYQDAEKEFADFTPVEKDIRRAFQFTSHYFPRYPLPSSLVTIIGPPDVMAKKASGEPTPVFIGPGFAGVSLQFYLGRDYPLYSDQHFILNVAPQYRSRRFEKQYIAADLMKLIVEDLFPDRSSGKTFIEQMVEKGKQWYLLDKLMPETPDSVKTGYTNDQLKWCRKNEGNIWGAVLVREDLNTIDPVVIQTYLGEGPYTQTINEFAPGNIGQWVGWQIVKKYAGENPELTPEAIMKTDARKIVDEAKYKPK